jgi:hypothetical protein
MFVPSVECFPKKLREVVPDVDWMRARSKVLIFNFFAKKSPSEREG